MELHHLAAPTQRTNLKHLFRRVALAIVRLQCFDAGGMSLMGVFRDRAMAFQASPLHFQSLRSRCAANKAGSGHIDPHSVILRRPRSCAALEGWIGRGAAASVQEAPWRPSPIRSRVY